MASTPITQKQTEKIFSVKPKEGEPVFVLNVAQELKDFIKSLPPGTKLTGFGPPKK